MDIERVEGIIESLENYTTPCSDIAVKLGEVREFINTQQQEIERLNKWIYDQGIKLDGIIPLIGMTNSERVEKAIDWLDHHGKPEIGE